MSIEFLSQPRTFMGDSGRELTANLRIAHTNHAEIFRAEGPDNERVAIKVPNETHISRDEMQREIILHRLMSAVHPGIIPVYDSGVTSEGVPWLGTPLTDLGTALDVFSLDAPIGARLSIGVQVAGVLGDVHEHGVHGDVKATNVFVAEDLDTEHAAQNEGVKAYLGDVGSAKWLDMMVYTDGLVRGTVSHFSPQRFHRPESTPEDDVWSLGCMMDAAFRGEFPFPYVQSDDPKELGEYALSLEAGPPPLPDGIIGTTVLDRRLSYIIGEILHPDPEKRISARGFRNHARNLLVDIRAASKETRVHLPSKPIYSSESTEAIRENIADVPTGVPSPIDVPTDTLSRVDLPTGAVRMEELIYA